VEQHLPWPQRFELMAMLFLHGMALAAWFVPMGTVLQASGLGAWTPFAFGASAVAALLSPLFFGAMADRSVPPIKVLRWVCLGTGLLSLVTAYALKQRLEGVSIWLLIQLQALLSVPTNSLSGSIVLARVANSHGQFGAIRAMGTAGWMTGCWIVSGLHLDASENTFVLSGLLWFVLSAYTLLLPAGVVQSRTSGRLTLRQRFGLDALSLLKDHDHRVIFITAALVAIPFAAFYPYTPTHMKDLGMERTSAWMSMGQVIEVAIMFTIGSVMVDWKLKWVILVGLGRKLATILDRFRPAGPCRFDLLCNQLPRGKENSHRSDHGQGGLIPSAILTTLVRMQTAWLKLVLIFMVAIQQTVAGVSCCCWTSGCVAPSSENNARQAATTQTTKPFCNKCKSKTASTKSVQREQQRCSRLSADPCKCKASVPCIANGVKSTQLESSKSKKSAPPGTMVYDILCQPDDLLARISLIAFQLAGRFEPVPAPKTTLARLSILNSWVI